MWPNATLLYFGCLAAVLMAADQWWKRILPRQTPPLAGHGMKHKRLLLFLGCLAAVLLAGYATLRLTARQHRITRENVQVIEKGMTEDQVEVILGAPAGDYSSKRRFQFRHVLAKRWSGKFWGSDEAAIWVHFDEAGPVTKVVYGLTEPVNESFLAKLRRWLGM
jgi:hypothetical protein